MSHTELINWVLGTVASFMRLSQAKLLALLAAAIGRLRLDTPSPARYR